MEVRQLFDPVSSSYSYLLWDADTLDAALIDPVRDMVGRDIQLINELGLSLRYTLETHIHADHVTGSGILRNAMNSIVLVHENCRSKCPDVLLKDGDRISLGNSRIEVMHTPGHTDSDVSYLIPGMAFTGDTLLIRSCGRTDYQSGDAGTLFDSITGRLFTLPGDTLVYPGHDYNGRACSTIDEEKAYNPQLGNGTSRDRFISIMQDLQLDQPQSFRDALPSNLQCGVSG
jgi:glyoxylase-like metal-dependent hydrolase (beta-lactamase superfamily II)